MYRKFANYYILKKWPENFLNNGVIENSPAINFQLPRYTERFQGSSTDMAVIIPSTIRLRDR